MCKSEGYSSLLLLEGAAFNASTTFTRGDYYRPCTGKTSIVCKECAVATHTSFAAIKDGRFIDVIGVCKPVPVLAKSGLG